MAVVTGEARITLAIKAIRSSSKLSIRRAVAIYKVMKTNLLRRMKGITSRTGTPANCKILDPLEEEVLSKYILDLDARGFPCT